MKIQIYLNFNLSVIDLMLEARCTGRTSMTTSSGSGSELSSSTNCVHCDCITDTIDVLPTNFIHSCSDVDTDQVMIEIVLPNIVEYSHSQIEAIFQDFPLILDLIARNLWKVLSRDNTQYLVPPKFSEVLQSDFPLIR